MSNANPLRAVTRVRCACGTKFKAARRDAAYCSAKCRQRAFRAREASDDIDREITEARLTYWRLVRSKAEAEGKSESQILTAQSQFVDEHGNVYMGGNGPMGGLGDGRQLVGRAAARPGWDSWGLEAAGPPFAPPGMAKKPKAKRTAAP
jgi:hypothetical protein